MIHYEELVYLRLKKQFHLEIGWLYFYTQHVGDPYLERKAYVGIGTVVWDTPKQIWIHGLLANMDRRMQRDLVRWFTRHRIQCVKAEREAGRSLPFARRVDDHFEIDVEELAKRINQAENPKPAPAGTAGMLRRATDTQPPLP